MAQGGDGGYYGKDWMRVYRGIGRGDYRGIDAFILGWKDTGRNN